jgi:hypothetical protein
MSSEFEFTCTPCPALTLLVRRMIINHATYVSDTHTHNPCVDRPSPPLLVFFWFIFLSSALRFFLSTLSRVSKSRGRNESVTLVELNQGSGTFVICGVHLDVESSCGGGGSGATDNNVTNIITLPHRDIF